MTHTLHTHALVVCNILHYTDAPLATKSSARANQAYKSAACTGTDHFRSRGNAQDPLLLGNASDSPSPVPRAPSLCASLFLSGFSQSEAVPVGIDSCFLSVRVKY